MRRTDDRRGAVAGPAAIGAAALAMLCWTWRTWPDVLIDFGRELYVPSRLVAGERLYADIAYFNGPLSPYLNALWFRLFGTSLLTLVCCNLAITAATLWLLHRLLMEVGGRLAATVACLVFVTSFGFGQLCQVGNYNYVCPYSHELTHGLVLSLAGLCCLSEHRWRGGSVAIAGMGLALGLVFLTKPEVFLAAAVASGAGLGVTLWAEGAAGRRAPRVLTTFLVAAALPPAIALAGLSLLMPASRALQGILGSWPSVLRGDVAAMPFYRFGMGLFDPAASTITRLRWAVAYTVLLGPIAALALGVRGPRRRTVLLAAAVLYAGLLNGFVGWAGPVWFDVVRPLPLVLLLLAGATFGRLLRRPSEPARAQLVSRLTLILFALVLLGKIILNVRLFQYGFVLAMPATLLAVVALVGWVPAWIAARGGNAMLFRTAALGLLAVATLFHLRVADLWLARKNTLVAAGADRFLADERGPVVARALHEIARRTPPDASLAVLPEGVMLNYLSGRLTPVPYVNFMPPEIALFGEDRILASLRKHPPDYVALVHKDTSEYGAPRFGHDYGQRLYAWIRRNYRELTVIGARPLRTDDFGIALLERTPRTSFRDPRGGEGTAAATSAGPARACGQRVDATAYEARVGRGPGAAAVPSPPRAF